MEIGPEMTAMMELRDKNLKTASVNMLEDLKENMSIMRTEIKDVRRTKCNYKAKKWSIANKKIN